MVVREMDKEKMDYPTRIVIEARKESSKAKKESHSALFWSCIALGVSLGRILIDILRITGVL